jgi:CxxC-x17-CxxC domain-containing protein
MDPRLRGNDKLFSPVSNNVSAFERKRSFMKKIVRSKNISASKKGEPDIEGFMVKIQEQLAALAAKMDSWIGHIPGNSSEKTVHSAPIQQQTMAPRSFQQPMASSQLSQRPQPLQGPNAARQGRGRRERMLHKAICADCQKDCEIPFKPTGERPVYCKACFSKRKAGGHSPRTDISSAPAAVIPTAEPAKVDRRVVVTKKGVGKVTVSEIVRPAARPFPSRDNSRKPAQKAKK